MGFLAAITGSTVVQGLVMYLISDKGGSWVVNLFSRKGWLGFGTKKAKAAAQNRLDRNAAVARDEKLTWIEDQLASLESQKKELVPVKKKR